MQLFDKSIQVNILSIAFAFLSVTSVHVITTNNKIVKVLALSMYLIVVPILFTMLIMLPFFKNPMPIYYLALISISFAIPYIYIFTLYQKLKKYQLINFAHIEVANTIANSVFSVIALIIGIINPTFIYIIIIPLTCNLIISSIAKFKEKIESL